MLGPLHSQILQFVNVDDGEGSWEASRQAEEERESESERGGGRSTRTYRGTEGEERRVRSVLRIFIPQMAPQNIDRFFANCRCRR